MLIAGLVLTGSEPSADNPSVQTLTSWYGDHRTAATIANLVIAPLFAFFMLFFGTGLRAKLRSGEAGESTYSSVVSSASTLVAFAVILMASIDAALVAAVHNRSDQAAQTIYLVGSYTWLPWAAPAAALLVATGLGGLRTAAFPTAFSWISLVLGVLTLTPFGIATFMILPLWLIFSGVMMFRGLNPKPAAQTRKAVVGATA
ncbi:MAG: hypothetical protein WAO61_05910 [Solirubrobacterales bacterium]